MVSEGQGLLKVLWQVLGLEIYGSDKSKALGSGFLFK